MTTPLIILTGASGCGKTTIAGRLIKQQRLGLTRFITCTTRAKRPGEKQDREYHFMDEATFLAERKKGHFFEWARVYGHYYGSHADDCSRLCKAGQPVLMNVDVKGMRVFKKKMPHAFVIFIDVPKITVLERLGASLMTQKEFTARTKQYEKETRAKKYADIVVPNPTGKLKVTVNHIACIIDYYLKKYDIQHPVKKSGNRMKKGKK